MCWLLCSCLVSWCRMLCYIVSMLFWFEGVMIVVLIMLWLLVDSVM